jgi:hypothetical protein
MVLLCRNLNAHSCEMIQYHGYFHSRKECSQHIDSDFRSRLRPEDHANMHMDFWCAEIQIERIEKRYLPKNT